MEAEKKISMEKFSQNILVRFATKEDIPAIMKFIENYWSATHILAHDREIFEFQYVYGEEVCFVLSQNQENGELEGVLGYIPYDTQGERDIFTALWKVRKGKNLFQGMDMLYYLEENSHCKNLYCAGINAKTFSIYKYMRKVVTKMEHYYMLREQDSYQVAKIAEKKRLQPKPADGVQIHQVGNFAEIAPYLETVMANAFPRKSAAYIERRFFHHPIYCYQIYEILLGEKRGYLIGREQACNGTKVFRIVDFWGDEACFAASGCFLQELLDKEEYEYADIFQYGLSEASMEQAGFLRIEENDTNIIPNYFEPFVRENVGIAIFIPRNTENVRMFKGDGDQDRPNFR